MRDIYLIDFENVASEGLSGITYLSEDDQVIIFYSNNSNRLTMKMHILIGKSVCKLNYFEVSVGGKNALDHQISTWLGYLVGTNAAERNYFIVSRDMGYKHVAAFWANNAARPRVRCIENIRAATRLERRDGQRRNSRSELENTPVEASAQTETPLVAAELSTAPEPIPVEEAPVPAVENIPVEPVVLPEAAPEEPMLSEEPAETEGSAVPEEPAEAAAVPESTEIPEPETEPEVPEEPVMAVEAPKEPDMSAGEIPSEEQAAETPVPERAAAPEEMPPSGEATEPSHRPQTDSEAAAAEKPAEGQKERPSGRSRRDGSRNTTRQRRVKRPENANGQNGQNGQNAQERHHAVPEQKKQEKQEKPAANDQKTQKGLEQLPALIAPYPKLKEASLRELIVSGKKQILCNTLRKQLGQEKGLALYNEIKRAAWH
ncbi:MAG: PIN domain-containing protein [Oscillospiraceae bacterium]|nr:PIN domain-containing protein [Oscillospiraceae bacterium]